MAEERRQFVNPEEGEHRPLEADTKGLVKREQTYKNKCML
jgi:hypothetical protein